MLGCLYSFETDQITTPSPQPPVNTPSNPIQSNLADPAMAAAAAAAAAGLKLGSSKPMIATQAEMAEARVPIPYRDQCAHLLIPLNKCRVAEFYLPWKCETERHGYEKCEYELVMERMLQMQRIREAEARSKAAAAAPQGAGIPLIPSTANA